MRVVFLAWRDTAHPQAGGSEVVIDRLATHLTERGHDVAVLHGGPSGRHNYGSHRIGGDYTQYLWAPLRSRSAIRRADVIVDVENGIPFFAPLWQRRPVVGLVHHIHTEQWAMQFPRPVAWIGRWLESRLMPRVFRRNLFVAVSDSTAAGLAELGIPATNITTIEMGLDFEPLSSNPARPSRFLVLSRLVPHKRVDLALEMWEDVRPVTGGTLVIVGDGPEMERLRDRAGRDVEFTGWVEEDRKREELARARLLVHPAHHEGWGTVIMEAAAAEVPALAFLVPGVQDSIVDGVTGSLADTPAQFIERWIAMATDDELRDRLARQARERASSFTWDRAVDEFEVVLHQVVALR
ncbi:MAG: glycosyltransferase family 4 protein [Acidimicrobiia bacterium]